MAVMNAGNIYTTKDGSDGKRRFVRSEFVVVGSTVRCTGGHAQRGFLGRSLPAISTSAGTLENVAESPEEETGKKHRHGKGQDPGQRQITHRPPLQTGVIRVHGSGDTRGKNMSRAHG
jgi:hypothetical protein